MTYRPTSALGVSVPLAAIDELLFRRGYLPAAINRDVLAQNNRDLEQQLIACRFAHPGEPVCPTLLGLLVAGKSPSDYWFSDRVEIHNPGGPFGQVTRENFGTPGICDYRNPHLAGAMKDLGFVQRFGMGIATALGEMAKNGNPKPEFQVNDAHVAIILRRRP